MFAVCTTARNGFKVEKFMPAPNETVKAAVRLGATNARL